MNILVGTPEGWDIYEYPEREQSFTLIRNRSIPHHYWKGLSGAWRHVETVSFHASEEDAQERLLTERERLRIPVDRLPVVV